MIMLWYIICYKANIRVEASMVCADIFFKECNNISSKFYEINAYGSI